MYVKKIYTKDLPDSYLENANDISLDLAEKICFLLDEINEPQISFNALRMAYKMIISSFSCRENIPKDVFLELLHSDADKTFQYFNKLNKDKFKKYFSEESK